MADRQLFLGTTLRKYLQQLHGDDAGVAKYVDDELHPKIGALCMGHGVKLHQITISDMTWI